VFRRRSTVNTAGIGTGIFCRPKSTSRVTIALSLVSFTFELKLHLATQESRPRSAQSERSRHRWPICRAERCRTSPYG
jgi:hypothetical protein